MILLMDGVTYEEWTPPSHDELEGMVKEHHGRIFGEGSLYIDVKHKLRGGSLGAIPDAYCLTFAPDTLWVVEVERAVPGCYDHIVAQLSRFMNGLAEPQGQRELRDALLGGLDQQAKDPLRGKVGELHPWLERLISVPSLLIATEKATDELRRASRQAQAKVLEFRTFRRQGAEAVHIHQFEPLAKKPVKQAEKAVQVEPSEKKNKVLSTEEALAQVEKHFGLPAVHGLFAPSTQLTLEYKAYLGHPYVPKQSLSFFPEPGIDFKVESDTGEFIARMGRGAARNHIHGKGIREWVRKHPELGERGKVLFSELESHRRCRLSIEKA